MPTLLDADFGPGATPEQKQLARAFVEQWRPLLFLERYAILIHHDDKPDKDDVRCNADCTIIDGYFQIRINIYPKFWGEAVTDFERRFFLLHELCHAITAKQKSLAFDALNEKLVRSQEIREANEAATDWVAQIVWRLAGNVGADARGAVSIQE